MTPQCLDGRAGHCRQPSAGVFAHGTAYSWGSTPPVSSVLEQSHTLKKWRCDSHSQFTPFQACNSVVSRVFRRHHHDLVLDHLYRCAGCSPSRCSSVEFQPTLLALSLALSLALCAFVWSGHLVGMRSHDTWSFMSCAFCQPRSFAVHPWGSLWQHFIPFRLNETPLEGEIRLCTRHLMGISTISSFWLL